MLGLGRSGAGAGAAAGPAAAGRRAALLAAAAALAAGGLGAAAPRRARAEAEGAALLDDGLASQLPGGAPPAPDLPRAYTQNVRQLVKALRDAIEAEVGGAKETEVRRKADPAKDLAKQFIGRWQDNPTVAGDPTHDEMRSALQELGSYYQRNGPRSRLTAAASAGILGRLDAVEAALPAEKKGLLGI
ncbi:MAG: photosystem II Pbs27 [Monoraphidium minutum]|nr:MAG: photosystem II Pbs27 [Monoraphidium minutum]